MQANFDITWSNSLGTECPADSDAEVFPNPSPTSSSSGGMTSQQPHNTPRSGRQSTVGHTHSVTTSANARAIPKRKKAACDVWTFFQDTQEGQFCVLCQYVMSI